MRGAVVERPEMKGQQPDVDGITSRTLLAERPDKVNIIDRDSGKHRFGENITRITVYENRARIRRTQVEFADGSSATFRTDKVSEYHYYNGTSED